MKNERQRSAELVATCKDILMAPYYFGQCNQVSKCETPGCTHVAEPHGLCLVCEEERMQHAQDVAGPDLTEEEIIHEMEEDHDNQTNDHR